MVVSAASPIWHVGLWCAAAVHITSSLTIIVAELTVLWSSAHDTRQLLFPTFIGVWTGLIVLASGAITLAAASLEAPALSRQKWTSTCVCTNLAALLVCVVAIVLSLEGENPLITGEV